MISYLWIFFVGLSACICDGGTIGSESKNYISPSTTTTLCDVMLSAKETVATSLSTAFGDDNVITKCFVEDDCKSLQCFSSSEMIEGRFNLKIDLKNMCQVNNKTVNIRAESLHDKRSLIIPLFSNESGRHKITALPHKNLFLKISVKSPEKVLTTSLQSCEKSNEEESETSCLNFPLLNLPYMHISECDDHVKMTKYISRRRRSSRSVPAGDLHTRQTDQISSPISTSQIDKPCDLFNIHSCGKNAACVNTGGKGLCECLEDFVPDPKNGTCIYRPVNPPSPTPAANHHTSYSPVLGAIFSIIILLAMAAGVIYGNKHQVFQRLRNRLPVSLRCWPFPVIRRTRAADDNVSLVYPIDDDGDDEPLLL